MLSVFWLNPVILLLIAWCFLRELAPAFVWIVTGIACAGALLLLQPRAETPPYLLLFPLAMATCFGAYIAMTRSLRTEDRRANLFYTALGVFVVFTPLIAHVWIAPSPTDLLVFIGIGVLGFFGLYAIDVGAATAPVSVCAPVTYSQLIFVMAPAVTVASQESTGLGRIGMLLLSISVACAWIRAPHLKLLEAR